MTVLLEYCVKSTTSVCSIRVIEQTLYTVRCKVFVKILVNLVSPKYSCPIFSQLNKMDAAFTKILSAKFYLELNFY